ncbi:hypothetical protein PCANC_06711 [Puccinia coronata f. sp. avenae]|uniref:RNA polymerase II transcription factor B subunit 3 n=1 Tax=Puccinia coronata f. sp. avenae TaxID=200324 RepID=A0A2N5VUA1_9BASI|nr:hypothetical protein PCASD_05915 [Puccinia coronata f. sp. avenae]PLW53569.1 hypothetical protein PCANC_06711 [Puccinia coronata f. sp. avenae]
MSARKPPGAQSSKLVKKGPQRTGSQLVPSHTGGSAALNPLANPLAIPNSISSSLQNKAVTGPSNLQRDQAGRIVEFFCQSDVCPVCKSDRYLNPDLRLLVSKCYHKMCESCIDRIFSLGPEPCPICGQTLRKASFAPQTFENLAVEKEVVIRKRISKYFNKRREDFMTLDAYNNYLEEVEDITFNLINGVDVAETEAKIKRFQIENQELIAQNAVHEARQAELSKRQEDAMKKEREERKAELLRLEEEARREEEEIKRATIRSLETTDVSAETLVARQRAVVQKRATARALASDLATQTTVVMPSLGGLIDPNATENADADRPDIEGELGQWDDYSSMFDLRRLDANLQPGYTDHDSMRFVLADQALALVGGFEIESVWERQLRSAMMGLFVPPPEAGSINQTTSDDLSLNNMIH